MQVRMRGKRVGIERASKPSQAGAFLSMPDDVSSVGYVRFLGDELSGSDLKVDQKVYFGNEYTQIRISGADILIMDEDNVFATAEQAI